MGNIDEMIYGHMTATELHEGISNAHDRINELTAENAKLRAELAEAVAALEAIANMTMSMVVNVQHMNDERGRIARAYLSKHTATT